MYGEFLDQKVRISAGQLIQLFDSQCFHILRLVDSFEQHASYPAFLTSSCFLACEDAYL